MNQLTSPEPTMSSREIAELTSKQHQHVKRDTEKMLGELGEDVSKFGRIYLDGMNRRQTEYLLDRELTETLLTGYSAILRRKVIARWRELEESVTAPRVDPMKALSDPAAMRSLLLGYTEKVIALEGRNQELVEEKKISAPKLVAFDRLARTDGSLCIRDAAKTLQVQEKRLKQMLIQEKWAYHRPMGTGLLAYADRLHQGLMEHKLTTGEKTDGSEWSSTQARITPKGMARLAELMALQEQGVLPI